MKQPSQIALMAADQISNTRPTDPDVLKLPRWQRRLLTKERNRVARIIDAAIEMSKTLSNPVNA
jgi:hypothetical protein